MTSLHIISSPAKRRNKVPITLPRKIRGQREVMKSYYLGDEDLVYSKDLETDLDVYKYTLSYYRRKMFMKE